MRKVVNKRVRNIINLFLGVIVALLLITTISQIIRINYFKGFDFLKFIVIFLIILIGYILVRKKVLASKYSFYIIFFLVALMTILILRVSPLTDQWLLVQTAEDMRNYNFSAFAKGGYLFRYPFQAGLVLFYYFISFVFGTSNYLMIQCINIFAAIYLVNCVCHIMTYTNEGNTKYFKEHIQISYLLFFPIYIYVLYIYGTLIGFSLGIGAIYHLLLFKKSKKNSDAFWIIFLLVVSISIKPNGKIIMVAIFLYLIYWGLLKEIKWSLVLLIITGFIAANFFVGQLIQLCIYSITGIRLAQGMPMIGWIAMGLSEGGTAPGAYNGFVVDAYKASSYDYKITSELSLLRIWERIRIFLKDWNYMLKFFSEKLTYQWSDPLFGADKILNLSENIYTSSILSNIKNNDITKMAGSIVQLIVYFGTLSYIWFKRKLDNMDELILAVIFIGGFIFHIFWEASPTYTFTYFILLIPYAIIGLKEAYNISWFKQIELASLARNKYILIGALFSIVTVLSAVIELCKFGSCDTVGMDNGYYMISDDVKRAFYINLAEQGVYFSESTENSLLTISATEVPNEYQIRFYPSGLLLGVDTESGDIIPYIDSIVNMEYVDLKSIDYTWEIECVKQNQYSIKNLSRTLSYSKTDNSLELVNGDMNLWVLQKQN